MRPLRRLLAVLPLLALLPPQLQAQTQPANQPAAPPTPTIQVTSRLVFLDVTVLDKKDRPVVHGLTREDFTITEDKQPQPIFSFEAPETHVAETTATADNPAGKAPVTIFVLDLLNSRFEDFAYIRYSVRKYLNAQPSQLASPTELMVLGNKSLEMVQGYTRSTAALLYALDHIPAALPYKEMNGSFYAERFQQSIDALQQIALQSRGIPGRKNIVWVGHGGPGIITVSLDPTLIDSLHRYVHDTTNLLVDARMSLFVIYPGLSVQSNFHLSPLSAETDIADDDDPFSGDINFGVFVNETGGHLFYNRNDVNMEIKQSQVLGSEYYTLTYQPQEGTPDGKFRRIRVTMRNPNLHVITKAGYFAPDNSRPADARQKALVDIAEAAQSTVPFQALGLSIERVVRHPDTGTAEFTLLLKPSHLNWQTSDEGGSNLNVTLAAVSLSDRRNILASRLEALVLHTGTQNASRLAATTSRFTVTLRVPRKTHDVRVIVQTADTGRIGSVELSRSTLDTAASAPTPQPTLQPQPLLHHPPAPPPTPPPA